MKKAKEYAEIAQNNNYSDDISVVIYKEFAKETDELIKGRNAKSNSAVIAVFKEQDKKWKALSRLTDGWLNPDGYKLLMIKSFPFLPDYGFCVSE